MRMETLWQGERRAARMHWWRQVLDRPNEASWDEVFDEMVELRFAVGREDGRYPGAVALQGTSL